MPAVKISIDSRSLDRVKVKFSRVLDKKLIRLMIDEHRKVTLEEFRTGAQFGRSGGTIRWPARIKFGDLSKRSAGNARIASGKLYNAVKGGAGGFSRVNKKSGTWGVRLPYAAYHRDGTEQRVTPRQKAFLHYHGVHLKVGAEIVNPARPWGGDSKRLRGRLREIIREYVREFGKARTRQ